MIAPLLNNRRVEAIVIGASAGGIDALSLLLPELPASLRAPVFVVQHLPKDRPSLLVEVFSSKCAWRVREAEDKETVEPGCIYFAPPDYHLLLEADGPQTVLSADEPVNFSRPSIDVLFESAADVYGSRLVGIILTGASQDGAAGLRKVQQSGGLTIVQQPSTAYAPLMAESARRLHPVDHVLELNDIAALLKSLRSPLTP